MITRMRFSIKKIIITSVLCIITAGFGFYLYTKYPRFVVQAASCLAYPILVIQNKCIAPVTLWWQQYNTVEELAHALAQAQHDKEELLSTVTQLQATQDFINDTKELTGFKQRYADSQAILSQILIKNISDQAHYCIVDGGSNKGVKKNMVAVYKNVVLGKIVEVYPWYSKLLLVSDRTCKVAAYCAHSKASGIHAGLNASTSVLMHVSHLTPIREGELILSSGDGLIFPRGFAIGRVGSCGQDGLFYTITVNPLVDIRKISYCYLLQKGGQSGDHSVSPVASFPDPYVTHMNGFLE